MRLRTIEGPLRKWKSGTIGTRADRDDIKLRHASYFVGRRDKPQGGTPGRIKSSRSVHWARTCSNLESSTERNSDIRSAPMIAVSSCNIPRPSSKSAPDNISRKRHGRFKLTDP